MYLDLVSMGTRRITCFFSVGLQMSNTWNGFSISEVMVVMALDANAIDSMDCTLEGMVMDDTLVELKAAHWMVSNPSDKTTVDNEAQPMKAL